jgi:hypothetical protein
MGVTISVYRLGERDKNGRIEANCVSEEVGWDNSRYVGDGETSSMDCDEVMEIEPYPYGHCDSYSRPKDFVEAMSFIHKNVPESNWLRWFNIFDKMENDSSLYFHYSF